MLPLDIVIGVVIDKSCEKLSKNKQNLGNIWRLNDTHPLVR